MLVIKIELWPYGDETKTKTLGVVEVINDGTGDHQEGNYDVQAYAEGWHQKNTPENAFKVAKIKNYDRYNGFWKLASLALQLVGRE